MGGGGDGSGGAGTGETGGGIAGGYVGGGGLGGGDGFGGGAAPGLGRRGGMARRPEDLALAFWPQPLPMRSGTSSISARRLHTLKWGGAEGVSGRIRVV